MWPYCMASHPKCTRPCHSRGMGMGGDSSGCKCHVQSGAPPGAHLPSRCTHHWIASPQHSPAEKGWLRESTAALQLASCSMLRPHVGGWCNGVLIQCRSSSCRPCSVLAGGLTCLTWRSCWLGLLLLLASRSPACLIVHALVCMYM
jgi:hypothetical protein